MYLQKLIAATLASAIMLAGCGSFGAAFGDDTPLHEAVRLDNPDAVRLLLKSGADVNARNNYGETPLDLADDPEVARLLRERGAK